MTKDQLQQLKRRYGIIGSDENLERDIAVAVRVAATDLSVLVTGENGTGKDVFGRLIHDASPRKHETFLSINCGAIPEGTIDSELFGHEKGAYTDAHAERKGYFEEANGGTLFLDEVGELPLATQARLLRVLETGEYIRMGSSEVRRTNVRVVAATNLNLHRAIEEGRFRMDLYYRLNSVEIRVPALRERKGDIVLLFRKFASDFSERYHRENAIRLSPEAEELLKAAPWSGNIRQLKHVAEQVCLLENEMPISATTLQPYLTQDEPNTEGVRLHGTRSRNYEHEIDMLYSMIMDLKRQVNELQQLAAEGGAAMHADSRFSAQASVGGSIATLPAHHAEDEYVEAIPTTIEESERELMRKALSRNGGNRKAAAAELGISERTLYRKISEYGL